jgi:imidazolonepropionase-like amidohydrolase
MRTPITLIAASCCVGAVAVAAFPDVSRAHRSRASGPRPIGITHVTVIDVERGTRLRDQTLIIEGSRIAIIGLSSQVRVPDGYGVVEARGKFVIPGLIDTHTLLERDGTVASPENASRRLERFVALGVTTIRTLDARAVRTTGGMLAPRVNIAGRVDSAAIVQAQAAGAADLAHQLIQRGVDGIAVGSDLSLDDLRAIVELAHAEKKPVFGVGSANDPDFATDAVLTGIDGLVHVAGSDSLIRLMIKRGVWLQPALVSDESSSMKDFVRRFRVAGGVVITGTAGQTPNGMGIHDELRLLVEAGLTPAAALRAATFDAARALRWQDRVGSVTRNKLADLLVLDADPLEDIRNTARINAIVIDGQFIDAAERDQLLARLRVR